MDHFYFLFYSDASECSERQKYQGVLPGCFDNTIQYKSVLVLSEEKDECVIATEVSFHNCFLLALKNELSCVMNPL